MTKNIFFSLLSFASSLVLAFFVSPMILHNLGDTRFGVWAMFGEVLTYYGLLDFGIRGAVNYFVGRSLANEEPSEVAGYTSSAFLGLTALSALVFVIGTALVMLFQDAWVRGGVDRFEVVGGAIGFFLLFSVSLPIEVFAAALAGSRRVFIVSLSELSARLLSTLLMFIGLSWAPSILVLLGAQLAGKLVYWTSIRINVRRHVPNAVVAIHMASRSKLVEMLRYGSKNLIIDVSWLVVNRKDVMLTTIFLGPQWVATYAFARIIVSSVIEICSSITQVIRPNLIYHWARKEYEQAYSIYYTIARYSTFPVLLAAAFLAVFGSDFIRLWIGERFVTGDWWFRSDIILMFMLGAQIPRAMHSVSWQILLATNTQHALSVTIVIEAACNLALAFWLVRYGTVGIAIALFIPMFLSHVFVVPVLLQRLVGISMRRYWVEGVGRTVLVALAVAVLGLALHSMIPPRHWPSLLLDGGIMAAVGLALGIVFVLRPEDRISLVARATDIIRRRRMAAASI
jgi:O-antigen/teichoic acid export membrane protein